MTSKGFIALGGLALVTWGSYLISPPAAAIVCGGLLLTAAVIDAVAERSPRR